MAKQKLTHNITCPYCNSKNTKKAGKRKNKLQTIQKYFCKNCGKNFIDKEINQKTYPANIILNALSIYNLGYTQKQTSNLIAKKHKIKVPQKTISNWVNEYKDICTFYKLRNQARILYNQETIIEKHTFLHNNLPYAFQLHKAKLYLLFHNIKYNNQFTNISRFYEPIKQYLGKIPTKQFPHHIFKQKPSSDAEIAQNKNIDPNNKNKSEQRASQLKFPTLKITKLSKNNLANKLTSLALNLAKSNKQRHQIIQNFFLINDSTTIATKIPVYLTNDDITYFISRKFQPILLNQKTPITGHIDILQIRNGLICIMDYKPDAKHQNPINQLTIYALALASRTKLALKDFKCAWFDEKNYYEFFPLHAVYLKS